MSKINNITPVAVVTKNVNTEILSKEKLFETIRSQYNANLLYSKRTDKYNLILAYCEHHKAEEKALILEALVNVDRDLVVKFYSAFKNWKNRITDPKAYEAKKAASKVKAWDNAIQIVSDNFADFLQAMTDDRVVQFNRVMSVRLNHIRKTRKG